MCRLVCSAGVAIAKSARNACLVAVSHKCIPEECDSRRIASIAVQRVVVAFLMECLCGALLSRHFALAKASAAYLPTHIQSLGIAPFQVSLAFRVGDCASTEALKM